VLQCCASGTAKFYRITIASQTVTAFSSIETSLSKLRVARQSLKIPNKKKPGRNGRAF